jgi:hypothetical protein
METSENLMLKLNEMLEGEKFYIKRFINLLREFKELENPKIALIDFEYYNEKRMNLLVKEKMKNIRVQNFEKAARFRNLEREYVKYIAIKEEYHISKSMFFYEYEYLFYFYFGTAKNDIKVREIIKRLI